MGAPRSVMLAKRVAEKKEKAAAHKAHVHAKATHA
jgi:hypothetical protein